MTISRSLELTLALDLGITGHVARAAAAVRDFGRDIRVAAIGEDGRTMFITNNVDATLPDGFTHLLRFGTDDDGLQVKPANGLVLDTEVCDGFNKIVAAAMGKNKEFKLEANMDSGIEAGAPFYLVEHEGAWDKTDLGTELIDWQQPIDNPTKVQVLVNVDGNKRFGVMDKIEFDGFYAAGNYDGIAKYADKVTVDDARCLLRGPSDKVVVYATNESGNFELPYNLDGTPLIDQVDGKVDAPIIASDNGTWTIVGHGIGLSADDAFASNDKLGKVLAPAA